MSDRSIMMYGQPPTDDPMRGRPDPWPQGSSPRPYRDAMGGGTVVIGQASPDVVALIAQARQRLQEVERLLAEHDALVRERETLRAILAAAEGPQKR